jgi:hypothetical protein
MPVAQPLISSIPFLENGDRLTRAEFEQRYHAMPQNLSVHADGIIRSQVFPGLWLAVEDLLAGNLANRLTSLNLGCSYCLGNEISLPRAERRDSKAMSRTDYPDLRCGGHQNSGVA